MTFNQTVLFLVLCIAILSIVGSWYIQAIHSSGNRTNQRAYTVCMVLCVIGIIYCVSNLIQTYPTWSIGQ